MYYVFACGGNFGCDGAWRLRRALVCVSGLYLSKTAEGAFLSGKRRDVGSGGYSLRDLFVIPLSPVLKVAVRPPLSRGLYRYVVEGAQYVPLVSAYSLLK